MREHSLSAGIDIKKTPRSVDSFGSPKMPLKMPKRKPGRPPAGPPRSLGGVRRADYNYRSPKANIEVADEVAGTKSIENNKNNTGNSGLEHGPSETSQFVNLISRPIKSELNTPTKKIKTPDTQSKLTAQPAQNSANVNRKHLRKKHFADITAPVVSKQKPKVNSTIKAKKMTNEMGSNNPGEKKHFTPKSHPELLKDMKLSASAAEERLNNYLKYTAPIDQDSPGDMASALYDLQLADPNGNNTLSN